MNGMREGQRSKAFPSGEGGSRVSRKRETDEGCLYYIFPHPPAAAGTFPQGKAGVTDCHTNDIGHWFAMTNRVRDYPKF